MNTKVARVAEDILIKHFNYEDNDLDYIVSELGKEDFMEENNKNQGCVQ